MVSEAKDILVTQGAALMSLSDAMQMSHKCPPDIGDPQLSAFVGICAGYNIACSMQQPGLRDKIDLIIEVYIRGELFGNEL